MAVKTQLINRPHIALIHRSGTIQLVWPASVIKARMATAAINILGMAFPSLMTVTSTKRFAAWELAQYQRRQAEKRRGR